MESAKATGEENNESLEEENDDMHLEKPTESEEKDESEKMEESKDEIETTEESKDEPEQMVCQDIIKFKNHFV